MLVNKYFFLGYPQGTNGNAISAHIATMVFRSSKSDGTLVKNTEASSYALVPCFLKVGPEWGTGGNFFEHKLYMPPLTSGPTVSGMQRRAYSSKHGKCVIKYVETATVHRGYGMSLPKSKRMLTQPCIQVLNIRRFRSCVSLRTY